MYFHYIIIIIIANLWANLCHPVLSFHCPPFIFLHHLQFFPIMVYSICGSQKVTVVMSTDGGVELRVVWLGQHWEVPLYCFPIHRWWWVSPALWKQSGMAMSVCLSVGLWVGWSVYHFGPGWIISTNLWIAMKFMDYSYWIWWFTEFSSRTVMTLTCLEFDGNRDANFDFFFYPIIDPR